ncbi:MAG TPA: hypothetical protein VN704_01945 [Verrucomicrobiae bacterium]|nr:hypothetical protein [Verrucomicrobiae bacterium]
MKYVRILTPTEANRYFIKIVRKRRKMFPPVLTQFTLRISGKMGLVKVDKQYRIWIAKTKFGLDMQTNDKLEVTKNADGSYSISKK